MGYRVTNQFKPFSINAHAIPLYVEQCRRNGERALTVFGRQYGTRVISAHEYTTDGGTPEVVIVFQNDRGTRWTKILVNDTPLNFLRSNRRRLSDLLDEITSTVTRADLNECGLDTRDAVRGCVSEILDLLQEMEV